VKVIYSKHVSQNSTVHEINLSSGEKPSFSATNYKFP